MKVLVIGGNRFVGLRLAMALDRDSAFDLHVVNRTGQSPHLKRAAIYKGDRRNLALSGVEREWDVVIDFANYTDVDTKSALDHFTSVGRYIHISTASVYDAGADRSEESFDAAAWDPLTPVDPHNPYQDGKRRAEALLVRQNHIPVVAVRFPVILGPDDYTRRLEFHVERIEQRQTLFIPNMAARISMIHAEDAMKFLRWCLNQSFTGPVNVASPLPISLGELVREIERRVGHQALLVQGPTPQNRSPYGPNEDCYLNCELMEKLGFKSRPIGEWLGDLIDGALTEAPPKILH